MKRFFCLLTLLALAWVPLAVRAQYPLGSVAAVFPVNPSRLVADPVRNRIYATVQATNSVAVIDTTTLQIIATIPIGSSPTDMAISMDGTTLYVVNTGSTLAAVGIVDLTTLSTRTSFSLAGSPIAIAAGLNGHVYVSASSSFESSIYQIDGTTGAVQAQFNTNAYDNDLFQISPDGTRLFVASTGIDAGSLESFDVSTDTPAELQDNTDASENDSQLVISHNGKYLCLPSGGGNPGAGSYETFLFSTADVTQHYGAFNNGAYPGPLAFSPDDSVVYQTRSGTATVLDAFSTTTFFANMEVALPTIGSEGYPDTINAIVTDNTGSYLFVAESSFDGTTNLGQLAVLTTGTGTLTPPSVLPTITGSLSVTGYQNTPFTYQITATGSPTSYNATNLPAGLSVDTTSGLISGTPTAEGYFYVTISASNASGTATATLTLDISYISSGSLPVITTASLPDGVVGQAYSTTVNATNSSFEFEASNLPVGLSIDPGSGVISGTPTTAGTFAITVIASNNYGTGSAVLTLTVDPSAVVTPIVTSVTSATGSVGTAFSYRITAANAPTSYSATGLPPGLAVDAVTGLISGTPTAAGVFPVVIGAINAAGTGTAGLSLTITDVAVKIPAVNSTAATGAVGVPFSYQIVATNSPSSYGSSGLPTGLNLDPATGIIAGTPQTAGTFSLLLTATNAGGVGQGTLTLTVAASPAPAITSAITGTAAAGQGYSYQITATNGPASFNAANLPPGLTVNTFTGLVSGVPTVAGLFNVIVTATNASGTGAATLALTVASELPVIDVLATVPHVTVGSGESADITVSRTGDLSQKLTVLYSLKGSARNGIDYVFLPGKQKIKAGKASATIHVTPTGASSSDAARVVKLIVQTAGSYQPGSVVTAKVKILPGQ